MIALGTGDSKDIGAKGGKYYSVNFPLRDGIDDNTYQVLLKKRPNVTAKRPIVIAKET